MTFYRDTQYLLQQKNNTCKMWRNVWIVTFDNNKWHITGNDDFHLLCTMTHCKRHQMLDDVVHCDRHLCVVVGKDDFWKSMTLSTWIAFSQYMFQVIGESFSSRPVRITHLRRPRFKYILCCRMGTEFTFRFRFRIREADKSNKEQADCTIVYSITLQIC